MKIFDWIRKLWPQTGAKRVSKIDITNKLKEMKERIEMSRIKGKK